jgi:PadR family transcriptional regulator PadR
LNAQFKKGVLELCVLALLARKDCYGFELVTSVSRSVAMSEGTVYPLLKRLRDDGLLNTYLAESSEGPPRKYYKLTAQGEQKFAELLEEWRAFCKGVDDIIMGRESA